MLRYEPSNCCLRSQVPATRPRSMHLWKQVFPPAPEAAEAAQPRVGPARSVQHRRTVFWRPRRGGTGQICGSSPLAEWGPFGNILQHFRKEFTTFGWGGITLPRFARMTKRRTKGEHNECKNNYSNSRGKQREALKLTSN